jgi:hypothetical protein
MTFIFCDRPRCLRCRLLSPVVWGLETNDWCLARSWSCRRNSNKARAEPAVSDPHLVNVRPAAVEARQVTFAGVPPIGRPNQTGDAMDQPNDRLQVICGHCPSCCGSRRGSDTYSTLISNKDA